MTLRTLLLILSFAIPFQPAFTESREGVERQFRAWLQQELWPRAESEGISRETFEAAFEGVTLSWDLPDLIPPGAEFETPIQQRQAEFGSPADYFAGSVIDAATMVGRQMLVQHDVTLAAVEEATGVPAGIILAVWGRESSYGRVAIRHDAFEVLGTMAFMGKRASYFTEELVAALLIVEAGIVPRGDMKSSWAGALGQPQFMPTSYLAYAKDGDGDDLADIWFSEADTIASIGFFLSQHGWVHGLEWGFEVHVPPTVSCALEGRDQGRSISAWETLGVGQISGTAFQTRELLDETYLLMPAGRHGPAFLVTPNFYVLKDYNMSDLYALFVGHVGDRIAFGMGDFAGKWRQAGRLYRSDIASIQSALEAFGYDVGGSDGLPGFKTRRSIGRWQEATGRIATCFPEAWMKVELSR